MKAGDLVISIGFGTRLGLVEEVWTAGSPRWLVRVRWNDGEVGTYIDRQLEVIDESR